MNNRITQVELIMNSKDYSNSTRIVIQNLSFVVHSLNIYKKALYLSIPVTADNHFDLHRNESLPCEKGGLSFFMVCMPTVLNTIPITLCCELQLENANFLLRRGKQLIQEFFIKILFLIRMEIRLLDIARFFRLLYSFHLSFSIGSQSLVCRYFNDFSVWVREWEK